MIPKTTWQDCRNALSHAIVSYKFLLTIYGSSDSHKPWCHPIVEFNGTEFRYARNIYFSEGHLSSCSDHWKPWCLFQEAQGINNINISKRIYHIEIHKQGCLILNYVHLFATLFINFVTVMRFLSQTASFRLGTGSCSSIGYFDHFFQEFTHSILQKRNK